MTSPLFRLRHLFDQLVELPETERNAFLSAQPDLGAATVAQLRGLISADSLAADLTARSAIAVPSEPRAWIGRRIGPYEITRELGHGGMGSVFLAERVDGGVVQQVAIKIVRPDRLDANTLARFRLERQVLALLQHPNIPGMLDLGELDDGSPYAVMEYVAGAPITAHVRDRQLDLRQRLELFLQICDAMTYAHANMIVHRDIKPGNVLVDGNGRPHLLDFGIAKPLLARFGSIHVEETRSDDRFLSLAHASPEQLRGEAASAACDVYGLGTLLYELLAGAPAFALGDCTPAQLEREICETDPPPPGRRAAANSRLTVPRDLDLITLRCLRKQPADRYASVADLAADVRRYLAGRPVLARHGNALYRMGRFVARHRVAVALTALLLALGISGSAMLWRQQLATVAQQARADEMTSLIMDSLNSVGVRNTSGSEVTAREVFERVAAQAQASPTLGTESRARVLVAVARVLMELRQWNDGEALLDKVRGMSTDAALNEQIQYLHARALIATTKLDEAQKLADEQLQQATTPQQRAVWQLFAGTAASRRENPHEALAKLQTVDAALLTPEQRDFLDKELSDALWRTESQDEAVAAIVRLVERQRERLGADSPAVYASLREQAILETRRGKFEQAEALGSKLMQLAERNRGRDSLDYLYALELQATLEEHNGNLEKSAELHQQMLAITEKHFGQRSRNAARMRISMGSLYNEIGDFANAETYTREGIEIAQGVLRPEDGSLHFGRIFFSLFLCQRDKPAEAQKHLMAAADAISKFEAITQQDMSRVVPVLQRLAAYQLQPDAANRAALATSLRDNLGKAKDFMIEQLVKDAAAKAKSLGVAPAP
jgi:tRNA A-37 threonylcarbamoyl transferase component Bud32